MNHIKSFLTKYPLTFIVFVFILCSFPFYLSDFRLAIMGKFICYSILAIGLDLLWGYTGLLSLGHGVFFGIGAYCMGMYLKLQSESLPDFMSWSGLEKLPWFWVPFSDFLFTCIMIILLPIILAVVVGYPVFRSGIKEVYFTILSQALSLIISILLIGQQPYTGGTNGLTNFQKILNFSINIRDTKVVLYYVSLIFLILAFIFAKWLISTKTGKVLVAIRDGENRLKFLGYNPIGFKLMVYIISAIFASIAGALFVPQVGIISPSLVSILPSVEMAMWVAIGGKGTILGPVFGTFVVNGAKTFLSENFPETWLYFLGILFIVVVFIFPKGFYSIKDLINKKKIEL
ncbi:MAG: urea ABC transporter permease subunit UrtC [Brevinematales bacterium]|nr:urea ABC transporter permease subunit UrtC [Brevinematales bacterium]